MSGSARSPQPREASHSTTVPRAIVHKKILDAAEADPDASIEALADDVTGASVPLVEQVLDEYGDPADEQPESEGASTSSDDEREPNPVAESTGEENASDEATDDGETTDDRAELTEKQRETLRAIYENPDATQSDLADYLGVSSATVCRRVNDVSGFDWNDRHEFVTQMFESEQPSEDAQMPTAQPDSEVTAQLEDVHRRVLAIERNLDDRASRPPLDDPELVHKVVYACMNSDRITEEEELRILKAVLGCESDAE